MASKKVYKTKCDSIQQNGNNGSVRLVIETAPVQVKEGEPPQRTAKTVVQIAFNDPKEAAQYEIGKNYTVTIEG